MLRGPTGPGLRHRGSVLPDAGQGTTLASLDPRRPRLLASLAFRLSFLFGDLTALVIAWLVLSAALAITSGDVRGVGWIVVGLGLPVVFGLLAVMWRGIRARTAIGDAVDRDLGAAAPRRPVRLRMVLVPFVRRRRDVVRVPDLPYGDAGTRNLLTSTAHGRPGPVLRS